MARFPYHMKNVRELGRLLAEAAVDPEKKKALRDNPNEELRKIGLPEQTVSLFNFNVVEEQSGRKAVTIPYRVNADRIRHSDPAYLKILGEIVPSGRAN